MTDLDQATTRRDITDALLTALERRHEVLDAIVDADDHEAAVSAIAELLGKSTLGAEAVLGMRLNQLTKAERRKNQAELDDLNSTLTFTLAERPASSGDTLEVRAFCADDADIFAVRTEELKVAGDGSGEPAGPLADEIALCRQYLALESLRLGERLQVEWALDAMPASLLVPPLMLQPLLENAVYHGIEPLGQPGLLSIRCVREGDTLRLDVTNPLPPPGGRAGRPGGAAGSHMALDNIRERLMLFFDLEAGLDNACSNGRYRVRIRLPYRTSPP